MQDDPFADRLKRLEERIEAARGPKPGETRPRSKAQATALGWRMVTELLAGMLLGLAIGYGLDSLLGTLPVFLVVFALLGFAAGVRTMLRSVEEVTGRKPAAPAGEDPAAPARKGPAATGGEDSAAPAGDGSGGRPGRLRDNGGPKGRGGN